jgi:hypothetical protein
MFGKTPIQLSEKRLTEINGYLKDLSCSHICHTTNKTCRGGAEVQAQEMFDRGIIPEPTVETMVNIFKGIKGLKNEIKTNTIR